MASPSAGAADLDQSLLSFEKLRASPDLWPEQIPGVAEFAAGSPMSGPNTPPKWHAEMKKEDLDMLQEFGSLAPLQLMEKVKELQNLAYQLGLEEETPKTVIKTRAARKIYEQWTVKD